MVKYIKKKEKNIKKNQKKNILIINFIKIKKEIEEIKKKLEKIN